MIEDVSIVVLILFPFAWMVLASLRTDSFFGFDTPRGFAMACLAYTLVMVVAGYFLFS